MRVRAYTIHWRRFFAWFIAIPVWTYYADGHAQRMWIFNLGTLLVLLLSIRRQQRGLEDDWPRE